MNENTVFQEKDTDFKYLQYVSLVGIRNCNLYLTCLKPYKHQGGCPICYFQRKYTSHFYAPLRLHTTKVAMT